MSNYFNEDDELTDEEYYKEFEPATLKEEVIPEETEEDSDNEPEEPEDDLLPPLDEEPEVNYADDNSGYEIGYNIFNKTSSKTYKVKDFNPAFLRVECSIKVESSKTLCVFKYRGETYTGRVLQKLNGDNYVFLIEGKPQTLKKIYIPDASLISAKWMQ